MSAWTPITTPAAFWLLASRKAACSQRVSAAVRVLTSALRASRILERAPSEAVIVRAGQVERDEHRLRVDPDHVLDVIGVGRDRRIVRLAEHLSVGEAERMARASKEQGADALELLERIAGGALLGFVAIGPFIVAGRVDDRRLELLENGVDLLVPAGNRGLDRRQDVGAGAGHAARVDVADMQHELHIGIRIDRIEQQIRVVQQIDIVGPIAEHGDRGLARIDDLRRDDLLGRRRRDAAGEESRCERDRKAFRVH